jgi:Pentapeptide repeats (8 copies)
MTNPTTTKSLRVRFEEVTPTNEIVVYFDAQLTDLLAGTGLPIFSGYDDLDNIQFAHITLPSGNTVVLGQYGNAPEVGVDLYVELDRKHNSTTIFNIPALVVETLRYLAIPREIAIWFHPDYETEIDDLYSQDDELESIPKIPTEELALSNEYEPIDCFYYALEIYTREKFPEHWAMLQHNLGLAYFDRIKGERWENLQKSIECFNNSLTVFRQDEFPEKWQINQEDLSQSRELWQVEKQNLIRDILDRPIKGRYLSSVNLRNANLICANLSGSNLSYANLSVANLSVANLSIANLSRANLSGSYLIDTNLSHADLRFSDLSGANLKGANVDKAQFGDNEGISELMRQDLIARGAIFEDSPGDRSESRTLVPR